MARPKKGNGYVGIANELWDEVIRRDFTKRQMDIILFIWRLSYGCNQRTAVIPKQNDFTMCGLGGKGHVGSELRYLERCKVIFRNKETNEYGVNKNYELWQISPVRGWEEERYKELVHINLMKSRKDRSEVTETGTTTADEWYVKVTETGTFADEEIEEKDYQNGNFDDDEELPKQEPIEFVKVTETGTSKEKKLPKQELEVTKTGTTTPNFPIQGKASETPKKGLNHKDIKKVNIYTCAFENFWGIYPRKIKKKETFGVWERLLKDNIHLDLLINCARNYAVYCKNYVEEDKYVMHPSTFLNKERYLDHEKPIELKTKREYKNDLNEDELQKRLEEKDREAERNL